MEKGFFKKHGVDITGILTSSGGGTSVRNMLAGDLPFGEVALSAAVARSTGEPLKIIIRRRRIRSTTSCGSAKKGSPLHSIKDLLGKRVGFTSPGSVTNMLHPDVAEEAGHRPKSVQLVPAGDIGANVSAVLNNAVDSGMSGEPVWSENEDKLQPVFWPKDILSANMMQTVDRDHGTTTRRRARPSCAAILAGRRDGVRYIEEHPDESADITAKAFNGDPALYRRVFARYVVIHYWSEGKFDYDGMDLMVEGLQIVGKQKGPVNWAKMVDASFLPSDLQN